MSHSPGLATDDAPTPWWEAAAEGTEVPVALVRVERVFAAPRELDAAAADVVLRQQARFTAGVEYIARAFGAARPLTWNGGGATLVLGGGAAEDLPARAYLAAKELWERARVDLDLPVRIGAHVGRARRKEFPEAFTSEDVDLCEHLAFRALPGAIMLSEDVVLALRTSERQDLASLGVMASGGVPTWVFPAGAASKREPEDFAERRDQPLWDAFRSYARGPDVRMLRYVGFRLQKSAPPSLDIRDVFVPPQAELHVRREARPEEGIPGRPRPTHRGTPDLTGKVAIRDLLARHPSAVVLGDPGSGKTTLIRWLAVTAASGRFLLGEQLGVHERLLPLPVSVGLLAEVRRSFPNGAAEVPAALARYFHDRGVGDEHEIEVFLVHTLETGRVLVLLDGLDEVRAEERSSMHAWLESFTATYAKNRFVATSRVVGFTGSSMPDAAQIMLQPFDETQVERYVRAFSQAYARWELGGDDAGRGEADAERLLGSLRDNGRLVAIATNPFMLSALALVHRAEGRLPRHRVQAYELFARALCETWADARRLVARGPVGATIAYEEEALPILGELAIAMHRRHPTGVAPKAFVVQVLAKALEARRGVSGEEAVHAADAFLLRAGREVQILLERGAGAWGFLHLTFQEFFAAAGLHALERFEDEAFAHLFDPRWEEVLRLGVGYLALVQKRPEAARRFVEKVLEYEAPEPERWMTSVLKKQVPLAALLAAEAGDALPVSMQRRVAEAFAAWVCDPPSQEGAWACLEELAPMDFGSVVEAALARHLQSETPKTRRLAAGAFGALGVVDEAEALIAALGDADSAVRAAATQALWRNGPDDVRERLENTSHDARPEVRAAAIAALMHLVDDEERVSLIQRALRDPEWVVRHGGLDALTDLVLLPWSKTHPEIVRLIRPALNDASPAVREAAVSVFNEISIEPGEVQEQLLSLAEVDPSFDVRFAAVGAVAKVASEEVVKALFAVLSSTESVDWKGWKWPATIANDLADHPLRELVQRRLTLLLGSSAPVDRARAADVLAAIATSESLGRLVEMMNDPSPEVRESAISGMFSMIWQDNAPLRRSKLEAVLALASLFAREDDAAEVRAAAAAVLAENINEQNRELIDSLASDPSPSVRSAALNFHLASAWELASPILYRALDEDPDPEVRKRAVAVIEFRADPAAVPHLLGSLATVPAAREALWKIAERLHQPSPPADGLN